MCSVKRQILNVTVHFLLSLDVKEGQVVSTEEVVSLLWEMMLFLYVQHFISNTYRFQNFHTTPHTCH